MNKLAKILVVDDEINIRESLSGILEDEGFSVSTAVDGPEALKKVEEWEPDAVLLDIWMPGQDGLEVLKEARDRFPSIPFIMMSGHGTIETAVKATKLGAFDFIEKPLSLDKVVIVVNNLLSLSRLQADNIKLLTKVQKDVRIQGVSKPIQNLKEKIARVAPTNSWVLITGENGTGKELVAQNIHYQSARAPRTFVEVNCAAIPEELIESELFGHEKGSFTGATQQKKGKFDQAHGGTLFLDEIGDMSLRTQAKILRILEEQRFERVGGHETILVDVRVVAATNKNLEEEIKKGNFREDLYYRLNVIPFKVPSLRERIEDLPILVKHFMDGFSQKSGTKRKIFTNDALQVLMNFDWPGNVRELRNFVERLFILTPGSLIDVEDLKSVEFSGDIGGSKEEPQRLSGVETLREARAEFEKDFIAQKLEENKGNVSKTADVIGLERSHLHRKMKTYGIEV